MFKGFTRPSPDALLGAFVRHEEANAFGQVVFLFVNSDRVVLVCRDLNGGEDFEILTFAQEIYPGVLQLVLEMPYADWDWYDTGEHKDPHKATRRHVWRPLPNED